jgi:hypothetical protein
LNNKLKKETENKTENRKTMEKVRKTEIEKEKTKMGQA